MPEQSAAQVGSAIEALEAARRQSGASQTEWARQLGISQGHYSKVLRGKTRLSRSLSLRARALINEPDRSAFESELLRAARSAPQFRQLLQLLLDMHFYGFRP
ncbi:helix-turn-helix domain-containing protein [Bosea caraganae]|uniref:helix-turn-helix domain-containing protein n=1 Tax=Bosea caraganae TaxID=2763117 RepID=UPI003CCC8BDB